MSDRQFIVRAGICFSFIMAALSAPIIFLLGAPIPVGLGTSKVMGAGAVAGVAISAVVYRLYRPVAATWRVKRLKFFLGMITLGMLGGAGGAALLDEQKVVEQSTVELPIVQIEHIPASFRRRARTQFVTLGPTNPTYSTRITIPMVSQAAAEVLRPGMCIEARMEKGHLGGTWISRLASVTCSPDRGESSRHVIVLNDDFRGWRWHEAHLVGGEGKAHVYDRSLPLDLSCRTRPGDWLYRCSRSTQRRAD